MVMNHIKERFEKGRMLKSYRKNLKLWFLRLTAKTMFYGDCGTPQEPCFTVVADYRKDHVFMIADYRNRNHPPLGVNLLAVPATSRVGAR